MNHFKQWWAAYGAAVVAAVTSLAPSLQQQYPHWAGYIAAALIFLAGLSKSPVNQ